MIRSSLIRLMVSFSVALRWLILKQRYFAAAGGGQLCSILMMRDSVRFQDVVKGFQLKGFHRMFFPRGDKDDKGLWANWLMFAPAEPVERRNIDIEKDGVDLVVLEKFQHVRRRQSCRRSPSGYGC